MAPPPAPPPLPRDTTLTLALPPPLLPYSLISLKPHPRRPIRLDQGFRVRSSPTGDTPPCTECGKCFPSWKALFGHMRCHPERQWRGITPPPHVSHGIGGGSAAAGTGQFTMQEREVAASLLMLSGARKGTSKGKKRAPASPSATESCGTSTSAAPWPANCEDYHKCSVCDRGFASGQALGGHKRSHWETACTEVVVIASNSRSAMSEAVAAAVLDLNLPPPGPPLVRKTSDQGSGLNGMLDLKLGYC